MFCEKCCAEFNLSTHHLTETGLEHAFVVDGYVSKVGLVFKKKDLSLYFFLGKEKKKRMTT